MRVWSSSPRWSRTAIKSHWRVTTLGEPESSLSNDYPWVNTWAVYVLLYEAKPSMHASTGHYIFVFWPSTAVGV